MPLLLILFALQSATVRAGSATWNVSLPAPTWWQWDYDCQCYNWVGPDWPKVASAPVLPAGCRLDKWQDTDRAKPIERLWLFCDLGIFDGKDNQGNICTLPSAQDTVNCHPTGPNWLAPFWRIGP